MKDITVCDYHHRDNEPCYGEIESYLSDGNEYWITVCEGHQAVPSGGAYISKDPVRRWIFSQQNQKIRTLEAEVEYLTNFLNSIRTTLLLQEGQKEIELPQSRLDILNYD